MKHEYGMNGFQSLCCIYLHIADKERRRRKSELDRVVNRLSTNMVELNWLGLSMVYRSLSA